MQYVSYCQYTGVFISIKRRQGCRLGVVRGTATAEGHLQCMIDGKHYLMHRLAWLYITGAWPKNLLDHIDGNPENNAFTNLREATASQNSQNLKKFKSHNKLKVIGVCRNGNGFRAEISIDRQKTRKRKTFKTIDEAAMQYLQWKRELHEFSTF